MKFIINKQALIKSLNTVTKVTNQKNVNPILNNLELVLDSNKLQIIGSNGETSILDIIGKNDESGNKLISIEREGSLLVNSRISEIVRRMEGSDITFELIDGTILKINDAKSSFKLSTIDVKEYPDLDFGANFEGCLTLDSDVFIKSVDQVAFAASTKDAKPILKAVNIISESGKVSLAATDTARLSRKLLDITYNKNVNVNVPAKTLQDVSKMLEGIKEIKIIFEDNRVIFGFGSTILFSSLISGTYPPVASVIAKQFEWNLEVNTNELIGALERVGVLFLDKDIVAKFILSESSCKITSKSSQFGSNEEILNTFKYEGEPLEISFNSEYLLGAVRAIGQQDVSISFSGEVKPFMVKGANKEDGLVQIITPLRTFDW